MYLYEFSVKNGMLDSNGFTTYFFGRVLKNNMQFNDIIYIKKKKIIDHILIIYYFWVWGSRLHGTLRLPPVNLPLMLDIICSSKEK